MKNEEVAARKRMEEILDMLAAEHADLVHELRNKLQILHYLQQEIILEKMRGTKESEVA